MNYLSNLSDAMLVLAVGIMLALIVHWNVDISTSGGTMSDSGQSYAADGEGGNSAIDRDSAVNFSQDELDNIVIAYEPVWAIGTGKTATAEDANDTIKVIRDTMAKLYCPKCAEDRVRIQYGGSMNPKNASELMAMPEIDGGLIGGASLKAEDFSKVVNF